MEPLRDFARSIEGIYFIHNFKGSNPAVLFRCYPDDWRVFRRRPNDVLECVWSSSTRPKSLKEIALDVLPGSVSLEDTRYRKVFGCENSRFETKRRRQY